MSKLRAILEKKLKDAAVSNVVIERTAKKTEVIIYTAKPGVIIGHGGEEIEKLEAKLEELNYIMPNIVRRFLEIYTLIKLPGNHNEIDNRVKILINDVNELKILHNFSHFTSLDRVVRHSEIIMRMPDIIDDIYTLVQKDEMHFNSLNEGIQKR